MVTDRSKVVAFYVLVSALLVVIVTDQLHWVLPGTLAVQVGHNSESLAFALLACPGIQILRSTNVGRRNALVGAAACAIACFLIAYGLVHSSLPGSLVTLNESFAAAGFVLLYIQVPGVQRYSWWVSAAILISIIVFFHTSFVTALAECFVISLIAPLALGVGDPSILSPHRRPPDGRRTFLWCLLLAAFGVAVMLLARENFAGSLGTALNYAERGSEAYWGWILVHFYFSVCRRSSAREGRANARFLAVSS